MGRAPRRRGGARGGSPWRERSGWAADAPSVKRYDAPRHPDLPAALVLALCCAATACEEAPRYATGVAVAPGEDAAGEEAEDVSYDTPQETALDVELDTALDVERPPDAALPEAPLRFELVNAQASPIYLQLGSAAPRWLAGFEPEGEALQPILEDCLCPCEAAPCDLDCASLPSVVALAEGEARVELWDGQRRFIDRLPDTGGPCIAAAPASPADALRATLCWGASVLEIGSGDYAQEVVCDTVPLRFVAGGLLRYEAQAPRVSITLYNASATTRYVQVGDPLGHAAWYRLTDAAGRRLAVEEDCGIPECHLPPAGVCGVAEPRVQAIPPGGAIEAVWRGQRWEPLDGRCEAPYLLRAGDLTAEVCWSDVVEGGPPPPDGAQGPGSIGPSTCLQAPFALERATSLRFETAP